jgi:hypothetical protein
LNSADISVEAVGLAIFICKNEYIRNGSLFIYFVRLDLFFFFSETGCCVSLSNHSSRIVALGLTQPRPEISLGRKALPVRKANLTVICEPIV